MELITSGDYFLLPFYLIVIFLIARSIQNKYYPPDHPWRKYFMQGLVVKIAGAILIGLIYRYYWLYGDTYNYFFFGKLFNQLDTDGWLRMITNSPDFNNNQEAELVSSMGYLYEQSNNYTMFIIASLLGKLCFSKYLVIATLLATITYCGNWMLFRMFATKYPHLIKSIAIVTLFIPSVAVWGSGLLKDTICLFAVSSLAYCLYSIFEKKKIKISYLILSALSIYLLYTIKIYILLAFLPIYFIKSLVAYGNNLKTRFKKILYTVFLVWIFYYSAQKTYTAFVTQFNTFSLQNIATTAKNFNNAQLRVSEELAGSSYDLGDFEPSLSGISKKFIPGANVTLFRPYLWEVKNPFMLLSALESLLLLIVTFLAFTSAKITVTIKHILSDGNILFALLFSLVFAFFIGISSSNFGTLVRFKIPLLPFFAMAMIILYDKNKKSKLHKT